jgi:PKD repeat protein
LVKTSKIAFSLPQNHAPTAALTADPTSGPAPLTFTFDGSGSSDSDAGDTLTYLWDFGDGTTLDSTNPSVTHVYSTPGTFTAMLTVRDNHDATSTPATVQIQVDNHAPTAALTADFTSGPALLTVTFDGTASSDPDAATRLTYIWDFGYGTTPIEKTSPGVTHVYSTPGTFTATLTVRDNHGATSAPATVQIDVGPSLAAPEDVTAPAVQGNARGRADPDCNNRHLDGFGPLDPRGDGGYLHACTGRLRILDPRDGDGDERGGLRNRSLGSDDVGEARLFRAPAEPAARSG